MKARARDGACAQRGGVRLGFRRRSSEKPQVGDPRAGQPPWQLTCLSRLVVVMVAGGLGAWTGRRRDGWATPEDTCSSEWVHLPCHPSSSLRLRVTGGRRPWYGLRVVPTLGLVNAPFPVCFQVEMAQPGLVPNRARLSSATLGAKSLPWGRSWGRNATIWCPVSALPTTSPVTSQVL